MKKHEQNIGGEGGIDIFQEFQNRSYELGALRRKLEELKTQLAVSEDTRRRAARRYLDQMVGTTALAPISSNGNKWSHWEDVTLEIGVVTVNSSNGRKHAQIELPPLPLDATRPDVLAPGYWKLFDRSGPEIESTLDENLPALGTIKGSWPGEANHNRDFAHYYEHSLGESSPEENTLSIDEQRAGKVRNALQRLRPWGRSSISPLEIQVAEE